MTLDRRLYFPSEGRCAEDFFALKDPTASARFEPANLGTKGTVTLHVIGFNLMVGYQAFKAANYLRLHSEVTPKHHTTHCQNANATVKACTTVNTT